MWYFNHDTGDRDWFVVHLSDYEFAMKDVTHLQKKKKEGINE